MFATVYRLLLKMPLYNGNGAVFRFSDSLIFMSSSDARLPVRSRCRNSLDPIKQPEEEKSPLEVMDLQET